MNKKRKKRRIRKEEEEEGRGDLFHQQSVLKFKEEISEMLRWEHSFLWC